MTRPSAQWSIAARRRLALVGDVPFQFRAVAASALADGDNHVEPEAGAEPLVVAAELVAERFDSTGEPGLFGRARAAFEGPAAADQGLVHFLRPSRYPRPQSHGHGDSDTEAR